MAANKSRSALGKAILSFTTAWHADRAFHVGDAAVIVGRDSIDAAHRGCAFCEAEQTRGRTIGVTNARTSVVTWLFVQSTQPQTNNVDVATAFLKLYANGDARGAILKGFVLSSAGAERSKPSRS